jgi:hypothetical protein
MTSFGAAIAALRSGRVRTDGIISHRFSLEEYGKALETLAGDPSAHKVVITVAGRRHSARGQLFIAGTGLSAARQMVSANWVLPIGWVPVGLTR